MVAHVAGNAGGPPRFADDCEERLQRLHLLIERQEQAFAISHGHLPGCTACRKRLAALVAKLEAEAMPHEEPTP